MLYASEQSERRLRRNRYRAATYACVWPPFQDDPLTCQHSYFVCLFAMEFLMRQSKRSDLEKSLIHIVSPAKSPYSIVYIPSSHQGVCLQYHTHACSNVPTKYLRALQRLVPGVAVLLPVQAPCYNPTVCRRVVAPQVRYHHRGHWHRPSDGQLRQSAAGADQGVPWLGS